MGARRSKGQSLVEFALTLPIFLLLVMGIVDLGRGVAIRAVLADCAREGARAGIIPNTADSAIIAAINGQSYLMGTIPSGSISITPSTQSARTSGGNITVAVSYSYTPTVTSMLSNTLGGIATLSTINMMATSTMLIE